MVVKPASFVARGKRGLVQPGVKVQGRGLNGKRTLALREFALGVEGLERFVWREPLQRVHECAFGVLALESEVLDPGAGGLNESNE